MIFKDNKFSEEDYLRLLDAKFQILEQDKVYYFYVDTQQVAKTKILLQKVLSRLEWTPPKIIVSDIKMVERDE